MRASKVLYLTGVVLACLAFAATARAGEEVKEDKADKPPPSRGKKMMERWDGDGDGQVTLEEFKTAMAEMAERRFEAMDADEDGVLTEEEFTKGRRQGPRGRRHRKDKPRPEPEGE